MLDIRGYIIVTDQTRKVLCVDNILYGTIGIIGIVCNGWLLWFYMEYVNIIIHETPIVMIFDAFAVCTLILSIWLLRSSVSVRSQIINIGDDT